MNELKQLRKMPAKVHQLSRTAANAIEIGNELPSGEVEVVPSHRGSRGRGESVVILLGWTPPWLITPGEGTGCSAIRWAEKIPELQVEVGCMRLSDCGIVKEDLAPAC